MDAIRRAPWSLRSYAALTVAIMFLVECFEGKCQNLGGVLIAGAIGVAVCTGNRTVWWLLVAWNAYALVLFPVFFGCTLRAISFSFVGLALLLAPASRRFVFKREP